VTNTGPTGPDNYDSCNCMHKSPPKGKSKARIDHLLVERGLADTREKAQALVMAGKVRAAGQRVDKAGALVPADAEVTVEGGLPFVGRGGLKLAATLDHFGIDATGRVCLDVGASTGGFTDC